ncbi:hypothetical protein GCM10009841_21520 [Microlunatus panaciterrae]|uniref:Uncharacterized protein n=1 Tax=Microlunatus panaciterrae TaxID=400768 RepID=A0ABS2RNW7_9ACTN|nr:hypothetical protein [Microlunatus panaciterrae]MBM7800705.1 hypothetical protein [Microlunatus panaciterrae]
MLTPTSQESVSYRLEVVWRLVLRSALMIEAALLLASLAVPLLGRDTHPEDSDPGVSTRLLASLAAYVTAQPNQFGDRDSPPADVPGGVWMTRIVLVLLLVALILAAVATFGLALDRTGRPTHILARAGGTLLLISVGLLALAQIWLSDDYVATPLQPRLLMPVAAGLWLLSVATAKRRMDELDTAQ